MVLIKVDCNVFTPSLENKFRQFNRNDTNSPQLSAIPGVFGIVRKPSAKVTHEGSQLIYAVVGLDLTFHRLSLEDNGVVGGGVLLHQHWTRHRGIT